jgi:hypothetical protein
MVASRRLILAAVVSALAVPLGCGRGDGAKLTLTYHPPAGAVYHYSLEQYFDISFEGSAMAQMPDQQMTMRVQFTQTVGGPVSGGIAVTVKLDSTTLDSPMKAANVYRPALEGIRGLTSAMVYDDRMNVVHSELISAGAKPSPLAEQFGKNLKEAAFPLPSHSVGVGDSWTAEIEAPLQQVTSGAPLKATTKLTVKEIDTAGPDTTVRVALETTFPSEPIKVLQDGQVLTLKLSGSLTGDQVFSVSRGAVLRSSRSGTVRINMKGATMGADGTTVTAKQSTALELHEAK